MNVNQLVYGAHVMLSNPERMTGLKHNEAAAKFQGDLEKSFRGKSLLGLFTSKECNSCREVKSLSEYGSVIENKDGRRGVCLGCRSKKSKQYYRDNKGK